MKSVGIICEYNPFHLGHLYQINKIKEAFPNHTIVAIMSGNFTQRGELAVTDKFTRAKAAVMCGVDLVLELPFPFSSLSAEGFACAGIKILSDICDTEYISFGAENENTELLYRAANILMSEDFNNKLHSMAQNFPHISFPSLRELAFKEVCGLDADILHQPNNILALEYIKAIKRQNSNLLPYVIKRDGSSFNSDRLDTPRPSACAIRKGIYTHGTQSVQNYLPPASYEEIKYAPLPDPGRLYTLFISKFFTLTKEELYDICGSVELCGRLLKAVKSSFTINDICNTALSKKFTATRIQRCILDIIFGIRHDEFSKSFPAFTRLLAANSKGRQLLKYDHKINIITKMADAKIHDIRQAELYELSDAIYASLISKTASYFIKASPFIL